MSPSIARVPKYTIQLAASQPSSEPNDGRSTGPVTVSELAMKQITRATLATAIRGAIRLRMNAPTASSGSSRMYTALMPKPVAARKQN